MWKIMKLTTVLMLTACMTVSAATFGQTVDFSIRKASLEHFFKLVERQTGYSFLYSKEDIQQLEVADLELNKTELAVALRKAFAGQPLTYSILDNVVIVKRKENFAPSATMEALKPAYIDISGTIIDKDGTPLPGASVLVKGTKRSAVSDAEGRFVINAEPGEVLIIRYLGYSDREVKVGPEKVISIQLELLLPACKAFLLLALVMLLCRRSAPQDRLLPLPPKISKARCKQTLWIAWKVWRLALRTTGASLRSVA